MSTHRPADSDPPPSTARAGEPRAHDDFAREIEAHLDLEADRLMDEGLDEREARLAARRAFGSVTAAKERFYESRRLLWLDHLLHDVRHGARALRRYPIACAAAIVSLACGIGAATATLTIRDVIFRRPPPLYREPGQLSLIQIGSPDRPIRATGGLVPGRLFSRWHDAPRAGAALAASTAARVHTFRADGRAGESLKVRAVTHEFFGVLGVNPALGSTTLEPGGVVLSDRVWRLAFDARPDVVGRPLWIDEKPYAVAGVMPEAFWFSSMDSPVWILLDSEVAAAETGLEVVARRHDGVPLETLAAQLQGGVADYAGSLPAGSRELRLAVSGIEGTPIGRAVSRAFPWALGAAVLLTLLIACANVAVLVIAQWTAREHEIAVRASLGASRSRIIRALIAESFVMAAAGGVLGIGATFALRALIVARADAFRFFNVSLDPAVLVESMLIVGLAGLVSGVGPALLETRRLHGNPMRTLAASDRVRQRWRHALVILEIAVTVALLVVTGGLLNTYQRQISSDVGFRTRPLLAMRIENSGGVPTPRILDALRRIPGVTEASAASSLPYMGTAPLDAISDDAAGGRTIRAERASIGAGFFRTIDVPMRAGRAFSASDTPDSHVVILNETAAARLFAGTSPVGRHVWMRGTAYEVAGVVAQYWDTAVHAPERDPKFFVPLGPADGNATEMRFVLRAPADPTGVARSLRNELRKSAPGNVVSQLYTLDEIIAVAGQEILVGTAPLVPLIATGLLLTAIGIYGVLGFAIVRRSRELAVRTAVGARGTDIVRLVAMHSVRLALAGTVTGIGATFALSRIVRASGGGGSFLDPDWPAFAAPAIVIAVIAVAATLVPVRRALRIDPATLLRVQ